VDGTIGAAAQAHQPDKLTGIKIKGIKPKFITGSYFEVLNCYQTTYRLVILVENKSF